MTVQPTRDQLRALASRAADDGYTGNDDYGHLTVSPAVLTAILDQLDQAEADRDWNLRSSRIAKKERIEANARAERAEQRIRDLTQEVLDERAACLDQMEQVKIRDARIKAVRERLTAWVDEYGHEVYQGNGWAEGVRDAAREALKDLDGEA